MTLTARIAVAVCVALIAGCASSLNLGGVGEPRRELVEIESGTYALTLRSGLIPVRTSDMKYRAEQEALATCGQRGQALAVLDSTTREPEPPEQPSATVTYRCVAR